MNCLICGAKCRCKKATEGLCCGCHRHKVRRLKVFSYTPELGVTKEQFLESLKKHSTESEERVLEFTQ